MKTRYDAPDVNNNLIRNPRDIGHTMRRIREGRGSQRRVLILPRKSGPTTQRELTARMGVRPGSASEVIGKLEAAGLVARSPSAADRRTAGIRLTAAGEDAAADAQAQRDVRHRQMFACLSPAENAALLELLERINGAWAACYPEEGGEGRI
nr:MarR family transcriptional regulator [uncultured Oscillibacter sp.]